MICHPTGAYCVTSNSTSVMCTLPGADPAAPYRNSAALCTTSTLHDKLPCDTCNVGDTVTEVLAQ